MQCFYMVCEVILEFYNRDKGRKALNLTEKYKKECWQQRKSKTSGKRE